MAAVGPMATTGQREQPQASTSGRPSPSATPARDHTFQGASSPSQLEGEIIFQNPVFAKHQSPQGRTSQASFPTSHSPASRRNSSGPRAESLRISPRLAPNESLVRTANGDLWSRGPHTKTLGTQASWDGDWVLNTRMSMAAQPSEALYGNPLATAASLTEQQSALESKKDILLTSRTIYDADGRYPLHHNSLRSLQHQAADQNQSANGCWKSSPTLRKHVMEDSALEAEIHLENMAFHKSMGKGGLMHNFSRDVLNTCPSPDMKQKDRSRHRSKPRLTKAQLDFMAMQPLRTSPQPGKKPGGIFHRQMHSSGERGRGGRMAHRADASGINRLDARNDRAMDTHARIIAWIEQGEWYWREHCAAVYSPVNATLDVDPKGRGKASAHSQSMTSKKKQTRQGSFSLPCCTNPCVK